MKKIPLKSLLEIEFLLRVQFKGTLTNGLELSQLKKGDILKLNQKLYEPLTLTIDQSFSFKAWPCTCQNFKAVIIKERCQ